jgi:tetratricopeptide (TPR) repeat protein
MLFSICPAVFATGEQGIIEFNKKNYKGALVEFREHLRLHPNDLNILYYAGVCYQLGGNNSEALRHYRKILDLDPKSKHASMVRPFLARYGITSGASASRSGATQGKALDPNNPFDAVELARSRPFEERIIIVKPKFGHQPVNPATVQTVKEVINRLPDHLYQILNECKATITIAPNLIDKWPGTAEGDKPKIYNVTMGEEGGRAYDADIHIYEREAIRNTTQLKDMRSQAEIRNCLLWVIAHALDHCMGSYTTTPKFVEAHKLDVENSELRKLNPYMSYDSTEGSAGVASVLLGSTDPSTVQATTYFTRLKVLVKAKLRI